MMPQLHGGSVGSVAPQPTDTSLAGLLSAANTPQVQALYQRQEVPQTLPPPRFAWYTPTAVDNSFGNIFNQLASLYGTTPTPGDKRKTGQPIGGK